MKFFERLLEVLDPAKILWAIILTLISQVLRKMLDSFERKIKASLWFRIVSKNIRQLLVLSLGYFALIVGGCVLILISILTPSILYLVLLFLWHALPISLYLSIVLVTQSMRA